MYEPIVARNEVSPRLVSVRRKLVDFLYWPIQVSGLSKLSIALLPNYSTLASRIQWLIELGRCCSLSEVVCRTT